MSKTNEQADPELLAGWVVAVILAQPLAGGMRCYVGEVQRASAQGLRITHIDWLSGEFAGADFWFPWNTIAAIEVYTHEHNLEGVDLGKIQTRHNGPGLVSREAQA